MQLQSIYVRFYRSLNYDFIRSSDGRYEPDPWDPTPRGNYPFVRIKLRPGITTVVGGNESGKTQILRAISAALTGAGYERSDFVDTPGSSASIRPSRSRSLARCSPT